VILFTAPAKLGFNAKSYILYPNHFRDSNALPGKRTTEIGEIVTWNSPENFLAFPRNPPIHSRSKMKVLVDHNLNIIPERDLDNNFIWWTNDTALVWHDYSTLVA
jgi:hypothetical protein